MTPGETIAHRICPFCEACCGLELTLSGGRVTRIRGHEQDVFSHGYICPKGVAMRDLHEDPDRLRTPLIRRDGRFVEATWEEAFAEIERRLVPVIREHGRDAVATVLGNPVVHKAGLLLYVPRLGRALGTRNRFSASTLDQIPKQLASGLMFGHDLSIPVPDIERTDFLLILGGNPMVSNGSLWTVPDFRGKAKALRARGGRLVVVDPRRSETAEAADQHLFIRPGSDVFLLLGMVETIFAERLVRLGRIADWVLGVEEVERAVAEFTPERVAGRCGIAAQRIRELAREFAGASRAAIYGRLGTCTQEFGTLASWLVEVLNIITGHFDEPGGAMFPKAAAFAANTSGTPGQGRGMRPARYRSRVSGAPEVIGEFPIGCLAEEIETPGDGQVRSVVTVAANPVLSAPNGARLSAALEQLDFMVSLDIYLNETSRHADVILPGLSPLEDSHYDVAFSQLSYRNQARFSDALFDLPAGKLAEWEVLLRLTAIVEGKALDASDPYLRGPDYLLDGALRSGPYQLTLEQVKAAEGGIDLGPLGSRIPEVLRTPSGKIELAPSVLVADLARAAAAVEQPAPEMVVIGRRQLHSNNSWMHNLPVLAKAPAKCTALVNGEDAQRLGLLDGAVAVIANAGRTIEVEVEISDEMMPGVVSVPHGWGHDLPGSRMSVAALKPGANLNAILDEGRRDPLSGNAVLSGVAVEVRAVTPG